MFAAFDNRDYRWLWSERVTSSTGFEMVAVAQGWLVQDLTGSALALAGVNAGRSLAMLLLSPYGGVISDRAEKRDVMRFGRLGIILSTVTVAFLVMIDRIQVWHLLASSLLIGMLYAFMMPAQRTIVSDVVADETVLNALALNSIGSSLFAVGATALAGVLIEALGTFGVYYTAAFFYLLAFFCASMLPRTGSAEAEGAAATGVALREGLSYLFGKPLLLALLAVALTRTMVLMPYRTLLPKFSEEVIGVSASGLGLLMAAPRLGSLLSSWATASLGNYRRKGALLLSSGVVAGLALLLFGVSRHQAVAFIALMLLGGMGNICMLTNSTLVQVNTSSALRGRVMSVYIMVWGLSPLGTMPIGALGDYLGVPATLLLEGGLLLAVFLALLFLVPKVRRLE
jgi:MFS family permease